MKTTQINIRLTDRHMRMVNELAQEYGSQSSAIRIAIEKIYEQTNQRGNEMKTQFTISNDKVEAIAAAANVNFDTAMEWLTADWEEGEEHQDWLDTADVAEIADWLRAVIKAAAE